MIFSIELIKKVLNYIKKHESIKLNERMVNSKSGFTILANEGFIEIKLIDGQSFATLTDKGLELLET